MSIIELYIMCLWVSLWVSVHLWHRFARPYWLKTLA